MKALLVALLLLATPAHAYEEVIGKDNGGIIFNYIAKYVTWYDHRADVRVTGECDSACTLVLAFIPIDHICATRNAMFGFHSASLIVPGHPEIKPRYDAVMTAAMWQLYNDIPRVSLVLAKHGMGKPSNHPDLVYIDAQEFVKPCPPLPEAKAPTTEPDNG